MEKTDQELIEEFLARGGVIEKITHVEMQNRQVIGSTTKKTPNLLTLQEGEELFGEKQDRVKKEKVVDYSKINFDLIPEHLRDIINGKK
jgi:hypothetical protein